MKDTVLFDKDGMPIVIIAQVVAFAFDAVNEC